MGECNFSTNECRSSGHNFYLAPGHKWRIWRSHFKVSKTQTGCIYLRRRTLKVWSNAILTHRLFTPVILKHLRDARIKATFHISSHIIQDPEAADIAKQIISEGHLLGLRYTPDVKRIDRISPTHFESILLHDKKVIKKILNYNIRYLRLPYDSYPKKALKIAEEFGFIVTEHSLDSRDFMENFDEMFRAYKDATSPQSSFISVHRDHSEVTAFHLPKIISLIKKAGLRPVVLSECIERGK